MGLMWFNILKVPQPQDPRESWRNHENHWEPQTRPAFFAFEAEALARHQGGEAVAKLNKALRALHQVPSDELGELGTVSAIPAENFKVCWTMLNNVEHTWKSMNFNWINHYIEFPWCLSQALWSRQNDRQLNYEISGIVHSLQEQSRSTKLC